MNKQQALEALLCRVRSWEQPHEEVRATEAGVVFRELFRAVERVDQLVATPRSRRQPSYSKEMESLLKTAGAAALYLLVDEVDVVEVPQGGFDPRPMAERNGYAPRELRGQAGLLPVLGAANPSPIPLAGLGPAPVQPINGEIGRRVDED